MKVLLNDMDLCLKNQDFGLGSSVLFQIMVLVSTDNRLLCPITVTKKCPIFVTQNRLLLVQAQYLALKTAYPVHYVMVIIKVKYF